MRANFELAKDERPEAMGSPPSFACDCSGGTDGVLARVWGCGKFGGVSAEGLIQFSREV